MKKTPKKTPVKKPPVKKPPVKKTATPTQPFNNFINHVCFIIDASGSMSYLNDSVIKVFDSQIAGLAAKSQELNQETRVSVYMFSNGIKNIVFDKDVLRLPSLKDFYHCGGSTALIAGTCVGIDDLKQTCTLHGDHSFLVFVLTDGEENHSLTINPKYSSKYLKTELDSLPEEWSVAILVPGSGGRTEASRYGFPIDNIKVWETTAEGLAKVNNELDDVTTNYMENRKKGIRGSKNLFQLDTSNLKTTAVKKNLTRLTPSEYTILPVSKDKPIKEFIEGWGRTYVIGSCYYLLMKPETIQVQKQIVVISKKNGDAYSGDAARSMLGLPDQAVRVAPANADWHIYVQSTSVNRKLIANTNLLVMN